MGVLDENEERILAKTLSIREAIIDSLTDNGLIPAVVGEENRKFLIDNLNGLEKVVLTKAKIKSDDIGNKNLAEIQLAMAEVIKKSKLRRERTMRETPIELPEHISIEPVDGEMVIGDDGLNYKDFVAKNAD